MTGKDNQTQEKKKGFFGKILDKLDKKMEEQARKSSCCSGSHKDKSEGSSCC